MLGAVVARFMAALRARPRTKQLLLSTLLVGITAAPLPAHEIYPNAAAITPALPLRIGVLANRGREECLKRWKPTAAYLERHLPGTRFEVVPLDFGQVAQKVASGEVQFIITNPVQYAQLEFDGKAHRITGFLVPSAGKPQGVYGGVIFTRADRQDIRRLSDLKGKRFSAVDAESLGGWLCARRELHAARLKPERDFVKLRFAGTHDAVLRDVLSGTSDAGTIRSSQLETMAGQGKVNLRSIRVIPPAQPVKGYPFLISTRLYPEWPFAVAGGASEELSRRIAVALMTMEPDDPAARASGGSGWTVPADYSAVHELLRELHLGPYRDTGRVTPGEVIAHYRTHLLAITIGVALIALFSLRSSLLNRRLRASLTELSQRTDDLNESRETLRNERDNLLAIFEAMQDAIYISDSNHTILYGNSALARDFGDCKGPSCFDYLDDRAVPCPACHLREVLAGGTVRWEHHFSKSGKTYDIIETPLRQSGRTVKLSIFRDVTELRRMEGEQMEMERRLHHSQKLESLGLLAGGIAHDFNNLLTVIIGNLDLARLRLPPDKSIRSNIESALGACRQAAKLIGQILDYTGKMPVIPDSIDLNDLLRREEGLLRGLLPENVTLTIATPADIPPIRGDRDRIEQVVMNLLVNGVEAVGDAAGAIVITTGVRQCDESYLAQSRIEEKPPAGRFVYLEVADSGCGMDQETAERIFEPFFSTKFVGRGLGLSAVQGIVKMHGGAIMLESGSEQGTIFRILFPTMEEGDSPQRQGTATGNDRLIPSEPG
jgi:two-component system sensor histidine kinase TtrS